MTVLSTASGGFHPADTVKSAHNPLGVSVWRGRLTPAWPMSPNALNDIAVRKAQPKAISQKDHTCGLGFSLTFYVISPKELG